MSSAMTVLIASVIGKATAQEIDDRIVGAVEC